MFLVLHNKHDYMTPVFTYFSVSTFLVIFYRFSVLLDQPSVSLNCVQSHINTYIITVKDDFSQNTVDSRNTI